MDLSIYATRFEELEKIYGDGSDEIIREDVNDELCRRWPFYALAGIDIQKIIGMMSDVDVWKNYRALENFGAKIPVDRFINAFSPYLIRKNWTLLLSRGANEEELETACRLKRRKAQQSLL